MKFASAIKGISRSWRKLKDSNPSFLIDKEIIYKHLPPNPIIIDCGAHIGSDSVEFAKLKGSKVFSFEPVPDIFERLKESTSKFENIDCFNIALGWFDGRTEMFVSSGTSDGSSSLLKPKKHLKHHPTVLFERRINVECKSLDSWAGENGISKVDMLWLDMQGAEQKMLMASKSIIDSVKIIHTEVSKDETYEGVKSYKMFRKYLEKLGFKIEVEAIPTGHYGGNVLFIRK
jgi:FkbM family methyltransferase